MNAEGLRKLLSVRPFEPLEVELSGGQVFFIKHPENVIVLKNTLVVADPETDTVHPHRRRAPSADDSAHGMSTSPSSPPTNGGGKK